MEGAVVELALDVLFYEKGELKGQADALVVERSQALREEVAVFGYGGGVARVGTYCCARNESCAPFCA